MVFTEMRPAHWETLIIIIPCLYNYVTGSFRLGSGDFVIIIYIHNHTYSCREHNSVPD